MRVIKKFKKPLLLAILVAIVLKTFLFDFIIAQGHSMEPSIKSGTVLIVNRCSYGLRLPFSFNGNGQKYLIRWAEPKMGEVVVFYTPAGELAVKRCAQLTQWDSFYAEGDNSNASYDSRSYGPVPFDNIIGKVLGH